MMCGDRWLETGSPWEGDEMSKCKTCDSPRPHLHPAMNNGGEVQPCKDKFHLADTPQNRDAMRRIAEMEVMK